MVFLSLVWRNLTRHWVRSLLTVGSLVVAMFLLCTLRTLVTTLEATAESAKSTRLWVQSAVSLFVDLPIYYPQRIEQVEGVEKAGKWQWFGGYYQEPSNFFGQFAVDPDRLLEIYPEFEIVEGTKEDFLGLRTACMVGRGIADQYGWELGDTIPITGALFPHPDGTDKAWEFQLEAIYEPTAANFDDRTFFFHWDYFEKTLENSETGPPGVGTIVLQIDEAADQVAVMQSVDALFENGPQRVQTTTEAEFQAQFVSMYGNVPFFVQSIGGGVLLAILLACINTMLMAFREQVHDIGILKAMGFTDGRMFVLLIVQSLVLCGLGGGAGILLARSSAPVIAKVTGGFFPGYEILPETLGLAVGATLAIGLLAGIVPAWRANRLRCIEALGATE